MRETTQHDRCILAGLLLQNERSFVVRRFVQRFLAGEMTAHEAIERIREDPAVTDDDPFPDNSPILD